MPGRAPSPRPQAPGRRATLLVHTPWNKPALTSGVADSRHPATDLPQTPKTGSWDIIFPVPPLRGHPVPAGIATAPLWDAPHLAAALGAPHDGGSRRELA